MILLLALLLIALPDSCRAEPASLGSIDSTWIAIPAFGRLCDTWLWAETNDMVGLSTPRLSGTRRTLVLRTDLTYELRERRAARDTVICHGHFTISEQESREGDRALLIAFGNWVHKFEQVMIAEFETPDILHLSGYPCGDCPEHVYVRGRSRTIEGEVKRGKRFRADVWTGRSFELMPVDSCWEIAVRDSARPAENWARAAESPAATTPPLRVDAATSPEFIDFSFAPGINPESDMGWGRLEIRRPDSPAAAANRKRTARSLRFTVTLEEASTTAP